MGEVGRVEEEDEGVWWWSGRRNWRSCDGGFEKKKMKMGMLWEWKEMVV